MIPKINAMPTKATPIDGDIALFEDAANSNSKVKVLFSAINYFMKVAVTYGTKLFHRDHAVKELEIMNNNYWLTIIRAKNTDDAQNYTGATGFYTQYFDGATWVTKQTITI